MVKNTRCKMEFYIKSTDEQISVILDISIAFFYLILVIILVWDIYKHKDQ